MVIQAYCIIYLKLKLKRLFQNLAGRLMLEVFAKKVTASKPLALIWITILHVRHDSEFVSGLLFKTSF